MRRLIEKSGLSDVICGTHIEERGVDLFNVVCKRNLEGVVAKRKKGTYSAVRGWLKIKNPNYTQSDQQHELFESFKSKESRPAPIPKKAPVRTSGRKTVGFDESPEDVPGQKKGIDSPYTDVKSSHAAL